MREHRRVRIHRLAVLRIDAGRIGPDQLDALQRQPFDRFGIDGGEAAVPFVMRKALEGPEQHTVGTIDMREIADRNPAASDTRSVHHQAFADIRIERDARDVGRSRRIMQRRIAMRARMRAHGHSSNIDRRAVFHLPRALEGETGIARPDGQTGAQRLRDIPNPPLAFPTAHIAVLTLRSSGKKAALSTPAR